MASAGVNADDQTDGALGATLKEFAKGISGGHLERFRMGTVMKLKCECHVIQRDQERLAALSNLRRVEQFILRLQELQAILKEFCKGDSYISYIWGAMQFLIRTAWNTFKDGLDGLLSAYERIGKNLPNLQDLTPLFAETGGFTGLRLCLVALYSDVLQFHSGAYQCFTQFSEKGRKKIFKSAWKEFEKHDMSYLESRMRKHKNLIEYGQQCLTSQNSTFHGRSLSSYDISNLNDKMYTYKSECGKEELEHKSKERDRREGQYDDALRWVSTSSDTSVDIQRKLSAERAEWPGTCDWIDNIEPVVNWLEDSTPTHPVLWIHGKMGAGKSTLASYIVEKCEKRLKDNPAGNPFNVTYFYCDGKDPDTQTFLSISRGLLRRQLKHIHENEKFRHLIAHCCDKRSHSGQDHLNADDTAESLLKTFFEIIPDQYIIVDGLDECERPVIKDTLRTLISVVTQQDTNEPGRLRLLIVSRELSDIKRPLSTESANADIFEIKDNHNQKAIRLYVGLRIKTFDQGFHLTKDDKKRIVDQTSNTDKGAQGMFLFAKLALDYLKGSVSYADMNWRLKDKFPTNIGEAYDRVLESLKKSLDPGQWSKAKCIFGWLTCSARALHWHEIRAIASIERDNESVEIRQHGFIPDVRKFCGTLVHVSPGNKVELVHLTAQRHILESEHVNEQEIQFDLATLCMEYLTFPCFEKGIAEATRKEHASDGFYAFQDYAVSQWYFHILAILKIKTLTIDATKTERFGEVLTVFMNRYQNSVSDHTESVPSSNTSDSSQPSPEDIKNLAKQDCASLEKEPFYEVLFNLWVHVLKHDKTGTIEDRNKPCLEEMEKVLDSNRKLLEKLGETRGPERPQNLDEFYGTKLYKCPRTRCDYFHEGLKDEKKRKKHIDRHNRPFLCPVKGCTGAEAGFISNKDLDRHQKNYHAEDFEGPSPFVQRPRHSSEAKFECRHCPKKFTRKINLEGHTRSHFGERPFCCSICNRRFTRVNDLKRHERLHRR